MPATATACNCSVCRRYGVLWAYGYENEGIRLFGETSAYVWGDKSLGFHFCGECGCVAYWRAIEPNEAGRRRVGVNLRLAEPDLVGAIAVKHLDGFDKWEHVERPTHSVSDLWY